jgi:L-seryl-tRNA(Ser) seleniumtransferase
VTAVLNALRASGDVLSHDDICAAITTRLAREETRTLVPVLNGTGIVLHTNLGRAPLAHEARDAMHALGAGYTNLEFDLASGARGSRYTHVSAALREATGAEDALVVNNCAAAVLLVLDEFARGREVVVARNQLIEIGGGFRLPDVLARSGATLIEVGATNKVYLRDYEHALSARTGLFFRSHASNFTISGFTADVAPRELAALGRRACVPVFEDLGSGALVDLARFGLPHERTAPEAIAEGMDLVAFSGDKLLGGPQAGIIVGRTALIARLRANPLVRALRVDKATLAALAATLALYLTGNVERIPFYAMIGAEPASLRARAERLALRLRDAGIEADAVASEAFVGGGSLPLAPLASWAVALRARDGDATALAARARASRPPLVARIAEDRVLIDVRTIPPERDEELIALLRAAT